MPKNAQTTAQLHSSHSGGVGCAGAGVGAEWVVPVEEMMVVVVGSVMKVVSTAPGRVVVVLSLGVTVVELV